MSAYDILVKVGADIGNFSREMNKTTKTLSDLGKDSQKSGLTLGKLAVSVGAVALAAKGFSMVKNSFSDAFGRIDTMEQFERVMTTITGSTEKAGQVLNDVNETVKGTAYGLDVGAKAVQDFVTSNMDVDKATQTFAAWGDAVAFYGDGSNETMASVSDALAKMTAKGKVQMDTMNRLTEAGIPAMQIYADATGQSVEEVAAQMQKGELDAESFTNVMNDALKNGTANFEGIEGAAKEAGASWGASFDNMQAAVTRGVVNIIEKIDEMLTSNGLPDMREMVANFGRKFEEVLNKAADAIPGIVDKIKSVKEALEPWMPLITSVVGGIAAFVTTVATINTVIGVFNLLRTTILAVNTAVLANPFVAIAAVIIMVALLVYQYWEPISEFFINLWNGIKEAGLEIWENLKQGWTDAKDNLTEAWSGVTKFFSELWQSIVDVFTASYDWLNDVTGGAFGVYVEIIQSYLMTAWDIIQAIWGYIKDTFSNFLKFIKTLVTGDFRGMKDAMKAQMETSKSLLSNIWQAIKNNIGAKLKEILSDLISKFTNMVSNVRNKATEIVTTAKNKFNEVKNGIRDKLSEAVTVVGQKIGEMPGKVREKVGDMIVAGIDLMKGLVDGIKNMGRAAIDAITGVVGGVVNKAKSLLKIKSPSRIFMEIGEFTGEGLTDGILRSVSAVGRATDKLMEAATPDMRSIDMAYATPSGAKGSLADAVSGTVDVNSRESAVVAELRQLRAEVREQRQMIIEMDSREVGRAVTPTVNKELGRLQSNPARKAFT